MGNCTGICWQPNNIHDVKTLDQIEKELNSGRIRLDNKNSQTSSNGHNIIDKLSARDPIKINT